MIFVAMQKEYQLKEKMYLVNEQMLLNDNTEDQLVLYEEMVCVPLFVWRNKVIIGNQLILYGFNGYKEDLSFGETQVFITKYGEVYHQSSECPHINIQMQGIYYEDIATKRNFSGEKYYPCERCCSLSAEDFSKNDVCYITEYGNRYHKKRNCRNITRWIRKVPLEDVLDREACSECW